MSKLTRQEHVLKSWSMFFMGIIDGTRTSDIRSTEDRRFDVGDILVLKEFDPVKQTYTGRWAEAEITYIQQNKSNPCAISHLAIADGYAVLSIKVVRQGGGALAVNSETELAYWKAVVDIQDFRRNLAKASTAY